MRAPAKPIPAARPSFARVALSGLYKNRRAYRALAAGVFLSIFFVSTMGLSLYSLLRGSEARYRAQVGMQDAILYRAQAIDPCLPAGKRPRGAGGQRIRNWHARQRRYAE